MKVAVKGVVDGKLRRWLLTDAGAFVSDFASAPAVTDAASARSPPCRGRS